MFLFWQKRKEKTFVSNAYGESTVVRGEDEGLVDWKVKKFKFPMAQAPDPNIQISNSMLTFFRQSIISQRL